jgi:undecaprenyl pyrophosphate phosphatase UppP
MTLLRKMSLLPFVIYRVLLGSVLLVLISAGLIAA